MAELQECITDDSWKQSLQSEIITALTESGQTQNHALEQVGYYYQCCAPAFLYKYYRDQPLNLNSVMSNKMWYSAPRNFNDAFDCDIAIDEQAIFNNLLPAISGGKTIRKGSPAWIQLKSNLHKQITLLENTFADQKSSMGITCLSEVPDSLLMWSHYANNHRGFCVSYNLLALNQKLQFCINRREFAICTEKTCHSIGDFPPPRRPPFHQKALPAIPPTELGDTNLLLQILEYCTAVTFFPKAQCAATACGF